MSTGRRGWRALGTNVLVLTTDAGAADDAARAVTAVLVDVDRTYSRFREDSELTRLNRVSGRSVQVSPLLYMAVAEALRGGRLTDGAVDPTVGRALRMIGYERDFSLLAPSGGPLQLSAERVPGWQVVDLASATRTVTVPRGVELDLGSTGKALAADLSAAAAIAAVGRGGVLVSLGGDISVMGEPPEGGWRVLVAEDSAEPPDGAGQTVAIADGGLATSSTTVRRWRRGEQLLHHIVDPATGRPAAPGWRTVTVSAASCVDANIAATASIVLGAAAVPWLEARGLDARLVAVDGRISRTGRWPGEVEAVTGSKGGGRHDDLMTPRKPLPEGGLR